MPRAHPGSPGSVRAARSSAQRTGISAQRHTAGACGCGGDAIREQGTPPVALRSALIRARDRKQHSRRLGNTSAGRPWQC